MERHLDKTSCMNAFATILQHGEKHDQGHLYEGVYAQSEDDGYIIRLFDDRCSLTLYFHNKHQLDGPDESTIDLFIRKIYDIAAL